MLLAVVVVPVGDADADAAPPADRYLVGFAGDAPAAASFHGAVVRERLDALGVLVVEPRDPAAFLDAVVRDDRVLFVEWDDPTYAAVDLVPNDALYGNAGHWGSKKIGAEAAWERTTGSTSVKVAVIDTGLHKSHEEFVGSGRVLQGFDFASNDADPDDDCGHGTHVAGTIGATLNNGKGIAGLAQATLLPLKGLSGGLLQALLGCTGSTSALANALRYAADQGAHVASNSWGGASSSSLTSAIAYAHGKGTLIVASAGNAGSCSNCVGQPWRGNGERVVVVSSTTSGDGFSSFSSEGPQVDVAAPGSGILSAWRGSSSAYATASGTSMAAPHVSGVLALMRTVAPTASNAAILACLSSTALDLGPAGRDDRFGDGRVRADLAVSCADQGSPPPGVPGTPEGLAAESGDGQVGLVWSAPLADGGSPVSHYRVYRAAGTEPAALLATTTGLGYLDQGLTNGAAYRYAVAAVNAVGEGARSAEVTATPAFDPDPGAMELVPGEPYVGGASAPGEEQFFKVRVPGGRSSLRVELDGPSCSVVGCDPHLDLAVRHGERPTDEAFDCWPEDADNDEVCDLADPAAGWWLVRVVVRSASRMGGFALRADVPAA